MAKMSLKSALDVADASSRVVASAGTMRWASWLQNSGIALDLQLSIEDLPFGGFLFLGENQ